MINCYLLKFLFVWNFHNKVMGGTQTNSFWYNKIKFIIKTRDMFSFLPLINNPNTTGCSFLLLSISAIILSNAINMLHFTFGLYSSIFSYKTPLSFA